MLCPECGIDNEKTAGFCRACDTRIESVQGHIVGKSVKSPSEIGCRQARIEPAGLLILFICGEMHPFTQRGFAVPVTFIQIQIAVWIIKLVSLLSLPAKSSFHNAQSPVAESAAGCRVVCFLTV